MFLAPQIVLENLTSVMLPGEFYFKVNFHNTSAARRSVKKLRYTGASRFLSLSHGGEYPEHQVSRGVA
jgi:hypothetical protein